MTREEAHTLLEVMAINLTGAIANSEKPVTEQTKLMAKQIEAIDLAISALQQPIDITAEQWDMYVDEIRKLRESFITPQTDTDLISRTDVIGAVHEYYQKRFTEDSKWDADVKMFVLEDKTIAKDNMEICNIINALPSAEAEWIPCSERLPEDEIDVLVTRTFLGCKDGSRGWNAHIPPKTYVEVAQYSNGEWTAFSDEYKVARSRHTDPIAWMPLPKPYREEE